MAMKTIFEWDGTYDIQPFDVGGTATTKTITTENTDGYVLTKAQALRVYANDAANNKNIIANLDLSMPETTGIRISGDFIINVGLSTWLYFTIEVRRYDGTNLNSIGLRFNSNAAADNDIETLDTAGSWVDVVGYALSEISDEWQHFDLIANYGATGSDPTYSYLEWSGTPTTVFPADGYNVASAVEPLLYVEVTWTVQAGSTQYVYIDNLKLESF